MEHLYCYKSHVIYNLFAPFDSTPVPKVSLYNFFYFFLFIICLMLSRVLHDIWHGMLT